MGSRLALCALALVLTACGAAPTTPEAESPSPTVVPTLEPTLAVPGVDVDWDRVGPDWHVVATMSGRHEQGDLVDPDSARIQLLSPTGERTDLVEMGDDVLPPSAARKWTWPFPRVEDVDPAARTVLLLFHSDFRDATVVSVDLATGEQRRAAVPKGTGAAVLREGGFASVGFKGDLVSVDWDGTRRRLGRSDGSLLPLPDRSGVVVSRPLRVASYDGSSQALTAPTGSGACRPARWWDERTVLLSCMKGSLWLVPLDGSEPTMLAPDADQHATEMDFGSSDAVRLGGATFLQREAGCGAGWIARLAADGTTVNLEGHREQSLVGTLGDRLVVRQWESCSSGPRTALVLLDPDTLDARPLLTLGRREELSWVRSWDGTPAVVG